MQLPTIESRVERLEIRMIELEQLPARVDALTARLDSMTAPVALPPTEVPTPAAPVSAVLIRIDELRNELRQEIRIDEDTRRFVRDLHEDLIRRITVLLDGRR